MRTGNFLLKISDFIESINSSNEHDPSNFGFALDLTDTFPSDASFLPIISM